jgi:phosphoserine phosphatase
MAALPGTTGRRRLYLMRHGHVDYFSKIVQEQGPHAVPLTPLGRDQATAAGKALAHVAFDLAVSSGYPRTRQTLDLTMAQNLNAHPVHETDARLVEIKGGGGFPQVKSRREIAALMAFQFEAAAGPGARMFGGGEAFADAMARCVEAIEAILARPGWHTGLVVAHEGVNRLILGWATGNGLKACQAFEQDTACVNILDFDLVPRAGGEGTEIARRIVKAVNLTPYNYVKSGMNLTSLEAIFEPYEARPEEAGG